MVHRRGICRDDETNVAPFHRREGEAPAEPLNKT